jgi:hypothetical protein
MITITRVISERHSYRTARISCDVCGDATPDLRLSAPMRFYGEGEEGEEIRASITPPAWHQNLDGRMLRDICPNCAELETP